MKKWWGVLVGLIPWVCAAQPVDEQSAVVWKNTLQTLVQQRQWEQARAIAPLGPKHFSTSSVWNDPEFQKVWTLWQQGNAYSLWKVGKDGRSIWRLAEGSDPQRPTVGIRQEPNGSLWVVFARASSEQPWVCAPSCTITLSLNGKTQPWTVRPPSSSASNVVGMSLPIGLLRNTVSVWSVKMPDGSESVFDMSFTPLVCQYKIPGCITVLSPR